MRVRWSEHEARSALAAWRKSGLSLEKFSKEHGLVGQRLYWWRKKLEGPKSRISNFGDPQTDATPTLLPVQVNEPKRGEPVAIFLRTGHIVKVGRGFDEEALARVVAILEGA